MENRGIGGGLKMDHINKYKGMNFYRDKLGEGGAVVNTLLNRKEAQVFR
jgi:hypothetical protein